MFRFTKKIAIAASLVVLYSGGQAFGCNDDTDVYASNASSKELEAVCDLPSAAVSEVIYDKTYMLQCRYNREWGEFPHTFRKIHDPEMVREFLKVYKYQPVLSEFDIEIERHYTLPENWKVVDMNQGVIVRNQKIVLCTYNVADCIGVSMWDPVTKTTFLCHAYRRELMESKGSWFQQHIDEFKANIKDLSTVKVNVASCYQTREAAMVLKILEANGFPAPAVTIPDYIQIDEVYEMPEKMRVSTAYINRETTPAGYYDTYIPKAAMAIYTDTGAVALRNNFFQ